MGVMSSKSNSPTLTTQFPNPIPTVRFDVTYAGQYGHFYEFAQVIASRVSNPITITTPIEDNTNITTLPIRASGDCFITPIAPLSSHTTPSSSANNRSAINLQVNAPSAYPPASILPATLEDSLTQYTEDQSYSFLHPTSSKKKPTTKKDYFTTLYDKEGNAAPYRDPHSHCDYIMYQRINQYRTIFVNPMYNAGAPTYPLSDLSKQYKVSFDISLLQNITTSAGLSKDSNSHTSMVDLDKYTLPMPLYHINNLKWARMHLLVIDCCSEESTTIALNAIDDLYALYKGGIRVEEIIHKPMLVFLLNSDKIDEILLTHEMLLKKLAFFNYINPTDDNDNGSESEDDNSPNGNRLLHIHNLPGGSVADNSLTIGAIWDKIFLHTLFYDMRVLNYKQPGLTHINHPQIDSISLNSFLPLSKPMFAPGMVKAIILQQYPNIFINNKNIPLKYQIPDLLSTIPSILPYNPQYTINMFSTCANFFICPLSISPIYSPAISVSSLYTPPANQNTELPMRFEQNAQSFKQAVLSPIITHDNRYSIDHMTQLPKFTTTGGYTVDISLVDKNSPDTTNNIDSITITSSQLYTPSVIYDLSTIPPPTEPPKYTNINSKKINIDTFIANETETNINNYKQSVSTTPIHVSTTYTQEQVHLSENSVNNNNIDITPTHFSYHVSQISKIRHQSQDDSDAEEFDDEDNDDNVSSINPQSSSPNISLSTTIVVPYDLKITPNLAHIAPISSRFNSISLFVEQLRSLPHFFTHGVFIIDLSPKSHPTDNMYASMIQIIEKRRATLNFAKKQSNNQEIDEENENEEMTEFNFSEQCSIYALYQFFPQMGLLLKILSQAVGFLHFPLKILVYTNIESCLDEEYQIFQKYGQNELSDSEKQKEFVWRNELLKKCQISLNDENCKVPHIEPILSDSPAAITPFPCASDTPTPAEQRIQQSGESYHFLLHFFLHLLKEVLNSFYFHIRPDIPSRSDVYTHSQLFMAHCKSLYRSTALSRKTSVFLPSLFPLRSTMQPNSSRNVPGIFNVDLETTSSTPATPRPPIDVVFVSNQRELQLELLQSQKIAVAQFAHMAMVSAEAIAQRELKKMRKLTRG